jgi:hypothetical protein
MVGGQVWAGYESAGAKVEGAGLSDLLVWDKFGGTFEWILLYGELQSSKSAAASLTWKQLDSTYEVTYTISAIGENLGGDLHEFEITDDGTALITIYQDVKIDCTSLGFENECWINDCMFREIDIDTGQLIFQWRASDHILLSDSYKSRGSDGRTKESSYDFFHLNSIEKDSNGNYLISSRHMHAIYYLDHTGNILWSLGGRQSEFKDLSDGYASNFRWQHHARWHENHTISLFDNNGNNVFHNRAEFSRGMTISLDLTAMTVELQNTYVHPDKILAISQGSMQVIPETGHVVVGWGNTPAYIEFTADGEVLCNMYFGALLFSEILDLGWVKSYRAFKSPWVGNPTAPPDIAVKDDKVFVSWNGATEVATWQLESSESFDAADIEFVTYEELPKDGFETAFVFDGIEDHFVQAVALDAGGTVLGTTKIIDSMSLSGVSTCILNLERMCRMLTSSLLQTQMWSIWSIILCLASFCIAVFCFRRYFSRVQVSRLWSRFGRRREDVMYELLETQPGDSISR